MRIITRFNHDLPLSTETIGYNWPQPPVERVDGYPFYHWLQTEKGKGVIEIGHVQFELKKGDGLLISPKVPHKYYPVEHSYWQTAFLTFGGALSDELVRFLLPNRFAFIKKMSPVLNSFISQNITYFLTDDYAATVQQSALVYQFLLMLNSKVKIPFETTQEDQTIDLLVNYIQKHYAEKISNNNFEDVTNFSTSHINKIFKRYFGLTPKQYLTDFRLRKAKALLITYPDLQIQDIASRCGFNDISHFIQTFHQNNNVTPNQFKNKRKTGRNC